jgi:site-specific recombinase XerD
LGNTTRALEQKEIHQLFTCIDGTFAERNRTMLVCGIAMALRATELVSLTVGDCIKNDGDTFASLSTRVKTYIAIRPETAKRKKERKIRIGEEVREAIANFIAYKTENGESLAPDAPLFVSRQGGHMRRQTLFALMRKIFNHAGIDESCHALRKTGATIYYIQSGYDLFATQEFLGHTDPSTTRDYIGLDTAKLIEYSESLSQFLFSSIRGEFDTKREMTNSLKAASDNDLLIELHKRGHDIKEILERMHTKEVNDAHILSIDAFRRTAS